MTMTAAFRAVWFGEMWGESGLAAVSLCRNDGYAASAESRFISAKAGETSAILPGTTPSVHQVERTWNS